MMAQNFLGLKKDINLQNDWVCYTLDRMIKNKSTPRYIAMKLQKPYKKKKNLESNQRWNIYYNQRNEIQKMSHTHDRDKKPNWMINLKDGWKTIIKLEF